MDRTGRSIANEVTGVGSRTDEQRVRFAYIYNIRRFTDFINAPIPNLA